MEPIVMGNHFLRCLRAILPSVCYLSIVFARQSAISQPIVEHADSIEWLTVDASLIVRGTIDSLETTTEPENLRDWHYVKFRVDETLKGEHQSMQRFVISARTSEHEIQQWKEDSRPLLAFLVENRYMLASSRKHARYSHAPRTGYIQGSLLELASETKRPVYTLELQRLNQPEDVLKAVKDAVAAPRDSGRPCGVSVSHPAEGGLLEVTFPVDSRLESAARSWLRSDDKMYRREGVKALVYFSSDANAKLLKSLLDDTGTWQHSTEEGGRIVSRKRVYEVRKEAHGVLSAWGHEIPRPILREPLPSAEP